MKTILFRLVGVASVISVLCVLYGMLIEPRRLVVKTLQIGEGPTSTRIVHLSDIHIGGFHMSPKRVEALVDIVNAQGADMVIITGDFISGHDNKRDHSAAFNADIDAGFRALAGLRAPTFATLGNHDNWYGKAAVAQGLVAAGVSVLDNAAATTPHGFCLVGLADHDTDREEPTAFKSCDNNPVIAAMHSPDSFTHMPTDTRLGLAGHTHGGQVNLPLYGRRVTSTAVGKPYAYGLTSWQGVPVYVTAGLGTSILPVRFRAPPEIAVITLRH